MIEEIEKILLAETDFEPAWANFVANKIADVLQENYVIKSRQPENVAGFIDREAPGYYQVGHGTIRLIRLKLLMQHYSMTLGEAMAFVREYFEEDGYGALKEPERNVL